MAELKKKARRGAGRVAFLAHLEGIKKMIDAGHPLVSVFEEYENKLSIKSGQFGKYVRKYVKGDTRNENQGKKPSIEARDKRATAVRSRTPDQPAFISSPTPRDDLIHPKTKE